MTPARRPHLILALAATLLTAILVAFAVALLHNNSADRKTALSTFKDRARISASLTRAVFSSSASAGRLEAGKALGGRRIDPRTLDRRVKQGGQLYQVVYDAEGTTIAASAKTPRAARAGAAGQFGVTAVLRGAPFALSDVGPSGGTTYVQTFPDAQNKPRVILTGFSAGIISAFIGGYLRDLPGPRSTVAYVSDSRGQIVGTPDPKSKPGTLIADQALLEAIRARSVAGTYTNAGSERTYALSPVGNSTWTVALTVRSARLYAGINPTVQWLILVALGLAGIAALVALTRALRSAEEVRTASRKLGESNAELAQSNVELQRSNAELEQFASVASHDLQEPLRKVQAFGDQLERRFGEDIPEEGIEYLRRMRGAAGRMSVLIDDLLRFSRVTTRALPPERVDLARFAHEVISDLDAALSESGGSVDVGALPVVIADPLQMRQLLQNLIANAIKFHRDGVPPQVRIAAVHPAASGMVAFSVTDNGIGFDEEYAERIFRVFERLHSRDVYAGTGIGLALCRKIAERHGGTIVAESTPDEGSRFTVVLPAAGSAFGPSAGSDPQAREALHV